MIYLISDRTLFSSLEELCKGIESALKAGIKMVQLREKGLKDRQLLSLAYRMRRLTEAYKAELYINDRADIALMVNAEGVHLGQSSMSPEVVRGIIKKDMKIGVSTHSIDEALTAFSKGADFITFGPVFHTPSKAAYGEPVGLDSLTSVVERLPLPVYAIGGIKTTNLLETIKRGAKGIALISGILSAPDIYKESLKYIGLLGDTR